MFVAVGAEREDKIGSAHEWDRGVQGFGGVPAPPLKYSVTRPLLGQPAGEHSGQRSGEISASLSSDKRAHFGSIIAARHNQDAHLRRDLDHVTSSLGYGPPSRKAGWRGSFPPWPSTSIRQSNTPADWDRRKSLAVRKTP